ncbi:MAG TPA: PfkB family carbohydrate kinase, partial [Ilumatobacteraceae bacterium]
GARAGLAAGDRADQGARRARGCVLVSTEVPGDVVAAAVAEAASAGVQCVLNPAPVLPDIARLLPFGPIVTPNESELRDLLALVTGADTGLHATPAADRPAADADSGAEAVASRTQRPVIVTLGADGVLVVGPDGSAVRVHAPKVVALDTTGAGDTFNGVLAARLAAGDDLMTAVPMAVTAASLSVMEVGARGGMPTLAAIREAAPPAP